MGSGCGLEGINRGKREHLYVILSTIKRSFKRKYSFVKISCVT